MSAAAFNGCGNPAIVENSKPLENGCGNPTLVEIPQPKRPGQYPRTKIPYQLGDNAGTHWAWTEKGHDPNIIEWPDGDLQMENEATSVYRFRCNKIRCRYCGKFFKSKNKSPKYCSRRCKNDAFIERRRERRKGGDL